MVTCAIGEKDRGGVPLQGYEDDDEAAFIQVGPRVSFCCEIKSAFINCHVSLFWGSNPHVDPSFSFQHFFYL